MNPSVPHEKAPSSKTIWITGGAGLIGRALGQHLMRKGFRIVSVDRVRVDRESAAAQFSFEDFDDPRVRGELHCAHAIVHLAGALGVRHVVRDPASVGTANRELTQALVRALDKSESSQRPRLFAASTSEVYLPKRGPLSEGDPTRGVDEVGRWAYAASKVACERLLDEAHVGERGPVHLRFFNVVGPGQDSKQGMVLPTFVEHALRGEALPVHGDGSSVRTLAHVDDIAETIAALIVHDDVPAGPLNVGGTARASVLELAQCVNQLSGNRAGITHVDPRLVVGGAFEDIAWREPDLSRLRALHVPVPSRSLTAIVSDTLARHAQEAARRNACGSPAS